MTYRWETSKERVIRGLKISPAMKLEGIRSMNEISDMVLTKKQKAARRKLRESRQ